MQRFFAMLDDEIRVLESLVRVTQQEHTYLLASEPEKLEPLIHEKQRLLDRANEIRQAREHVVQSSLRALKASDEAHRLMDLIELVSPTHQPPLIARRDQICSLTETLRELNEASGVYARRQLRWVRATRKKLHADQTHDMDLYDSHGRSGTAQVVGRRLGVRA